MKTNLIGTRIDDELFTLFIQYATEHAWSKSFALAQIIEHFFSKEIKG